VDHLLDLLSEGATPDELLAYKDAALIRAEEDGDLDSGILPAGQVASGIRDIVSVAQFVPAMAAEAAAVLSRLAPAAQATTAR
jgi:NAD(P)H-dependent flavin oxidoreductase YrpB (nitropropane dioxygenase family)